MKLVPSGAVGGWDPLQETGLHRVVGQVTAPADDLEERRRDKLYLVICLYIDTERFDDELGLTDKH